MTEIEQAYRITESITRTAARNFYYGIRLLPREKRAALSAVYALGRRIDDVADGELAPETKITELDAIRKSLDNIDDSSDPVLVALADAARRFPVPIAMFAELIDGARMEIDWTGCRDFDELIVYCRRGAGTIGKLCLSIFGPGSTATSRYAEQLGIALQQTNILRDVREDFLNGRIYLPRDELDRLGVRLRLDDTGALDDPDGRLAALLRFSADRAADCVFAGTAADSTPRPPQRCLLCGHVWHLPPSARLDQSIAGGRLRSANLSVGTEEGPSGGGSTGLFGNLRTGPWTATGRPRESPQPLD